MKLTGKAKERFEKWFSEKPYTARSFYGDLGIHINAQFILFEDLPPSMQWGVIQDWADSIGYDMITEASSEQDKYWYTIYNKSIDSYNDEMYKTRQEARNAAIEKLDQLIN